MLITYLFLLLLFSTIEEIYACPEGCDCISDPQHPISLFASCNWQNILESSLSKTPGLRRVEARCGGGPVPEGALVQALTVQHLTIRNCKLPLDNGEFFTGLENLRSLHLYEISSSPFTLQETALEPLAKLEKLFLVSSNLEKLPQTTLCHLKNLQVLNVSHNVMKSLELEKTCNGSQLIIVDFSHNHFETIGTDLHVLPAVRQLSLANNRLTSMAPSAFSNSLFLQQLDLQNNLVDDLTDLPATLIHVNLARNRLQVLPPALASLASLVSLNLSHNNIDQSSPSVLVTSSLESLDLSWNRLGRLPTRLMPNSLAHLMHLNLQNNQVNDIGNGELHNFTKLQTLDVSSNALSIVHDATFLPTHQLSVLRLRNNSIHMVESAVFVDMQIGELDLSSNALNEVPIAIGRIASLKKLIISNNKISKLYHFILNKVPHLHHLDLSHNQLTSIGPYMISDSAHLSYLNLSNNQIAALLKDAFIKCPQLKKLDLSDNRIETYESALSQSKSIRKLDISNNRLRYLKWQGLPISLETLKADNNVIAKLEAAERSMVRHASLRGNDIVDLVSDVIPDAMETLDLTNNKINKIASKTFGSKSGLRKLGLQNNRLVVVGKEQVEVVDGVHPVEISVNGNPLECSCELSWISKISKRKVVVSDIEEVVCKSPVDGRSQKLQGISTQDLLCKYQQVCEPECPCCQFANCDCKSVCPSGCRCFHDSVYNTNIVRCENLNETNMKMFSATDVPQSASTVYLSGLSLPVLHAHSFLARIRLKHLYINASNVLNIQPNAFISLPNLKLLDLSDNGISRLTGDEFHFTSNITHLFLNGNRLANVQQGLLDKLQKLQVMTLHGNRLEDVSSSMKKSKVKSFSLGGNPFRCDCSTDRFSAPSWILENRYKVMDADRVICMENVTKAFATNDSTILAAFPPTSGHDLVIMKMDDFLRDYNRSICVVPSHGLFGAEPRSSILLFSLLLGTLLVLLSLIAVAIKWAKSTHSAIHQRRYKASSLNCSSSPGSSPLPLPLISYDAFVSYARKDEKIVVEQVCRQLEESDYSLCLLHRDSPIYHQRAQAISDELIAQMDTAQALILVLSRAFLQNEWSQLQIKTSHQLFAKNRNKRLITIFVDDGMDQNLLDDELGQMLRKNVCLRLSDPLFWSLLRSALPARMSPPSDSSQIYSDMYGIVPSAIV